MKDYRGEYRGTEPKTNKPYNRPPSQFKNEGWTGTEKTPMCDVCIYKEICKYVTEAIELQEIVGKIRPRQSLNGSPVKVVVGCYKFQPGLIRR